MAQVTNHPWRSPEAMPPGIIVNADDLGIQPNINAGILSAYRNGVLTSCTMLMTTPYLEQTVRDYVQPRVLPIGVHLCLTLGKAAATIDAVPDLVDAEGNFKLSADRLILASFKGPRGEALLAQIGREFEAQLARARDHGVRPTHADSHQHVHMNPAIFHVVESLLPRFGIGRMRLSREPFRGFVLGPDLPGLIRRNNLPKWALLRWCATGLRPELATPDEFFGVLYSGVIGKRALMALLRAIPPQRSLEICIHPGFPAPKGITDYSRFGTNNAFISAPARQAEHDVLIDPEVAELMRVRNLPLRAFDGSVKG
jgi:hypothetical protein